MSSNKASKQPKLTVKERVSEELAPISDQPKPVVVDSFRRNAPTERRALLGPDLRIWLRMGKAHAFMSPEYSCILACHESIHSTPPVRRRASVKPSTGQEAPVRHCQRANTIGQLPCQTAGQGSGAGEDAQPTPAATATAGAHRSKPRAMSRELPKCCAIAAPASTPSSN